jgi:threonine/homoserine/homoserine lactone efflux protein
MVTPAMTSFGVGLALASAPGPVQAVLLAEAVRGGVGRGLRALAGVHLTFGLLLASLALGLSLAPPSGLLLRALRLAGGVMLLWLAWDGVRSRSRHAIGQAAPWSSRRRTLPPAMRGVLAIVLNGGAWLFLAAVASPLLAAASLQGGKVASVVAALALVAGAAIGDLAVILLGAVGVRRAGERATRQVYRVLAIVLASFGVWLVVAAVR